MKYYIFPLILALCLNVYGEEIDIRRIIAIESNGNPNAYNKSSGAIGLMQITPVVIKEFNQRYSGEWLHYKPPYKELFDYCDNVKIGTWYINVRIPQLLEAYGIKDTIENRLIAYSWGVGNLRKYLKGERKLPKETRDYLRKYKEK